MIAIFVEAMKLVNVNHTHNLRIQSLHLKYVMTPIYVGIASIVSYMHGYMALTTSSVLNNSIKLAKS